MSWRGKSRQQHPACDDVADPSRRAALGGALAGLLLTSAPVGNTARAAGADEAGRLKQSVCRWPFHAIALPELCRRIKQLGLAAIDLLYVDEWPIARDAGLVVSMGYASRREKFIETGFNNPAHHELLLKELEFALPLAARAGV